LAAAHHHPERAGARHLCYSGLRPHVYGLSRALGSCRDGCTGSWAALATRRTRCPSCTWPAARPRAPSRPCWRQSFRPPATGWPHTPGARATILVGRPAAPASNTQFWPPWGSFKQGGLTLATYPVPDRASLCSLRCPGQQVYEANACHAASAYAGTTALGRSQTPYRSTLLVQDIMAWMYPEFHLLRAY